MYPVLEKTLVNVKITIECCRILLLLLFLGNHTSSWLQNSTTKNLDKGTLYVQLETKKKFEEETEVIEVRTKRDLKRLKGNNQGK